MNGIIVLLALPVMFSLGAVFGAWWATRDRPADDWHDNLKL